ncbi:D-alanyl-D-alanine carboxypeptidase family protein [uncultured Corynebacterium sp.]|uniref:D-alanyl-D-alanine carboxypeptidase family protein n=1 Tax=uncultured Corynebacterium sp. TaxID=159447 RepID=UPI002596EACE|nr:D-alanyl-D-alanine carboxypeptidase [uncultured Corynebacterium sp.]
MPTTTRTRLVLAASLALCLGAAPSAPVALAEPGAPAPELTPAPAAPVRGHYEGESLVPESRETAPQTDSCPRATWPPEPVSTSEALAPGTSPAPLPVAYSGPCGVSAPPGFTVDESVLASAWLVADLDTGEVVAMKDPHGRYRPASVIKVLLALVAIDELALDATVTASHDSAAQEGSRVGLVEGGTYTVNDLLHGLLLASGNDAAHALAQELGGDEAALRKVNELAQRLGMPDTRAVSYSGLDAPGMSSSAFDLGLSYRAAFNNDTFAHIVDTEFYDFPGHEDLPGYQVWNDNHLYLNDPEGIGGKTGYTDDANHTFVGAVNHDGHRLLAVVLDTTAGKARPWEQAQRLLHESYGFVGRGGVAKLERERDTPTEADNSEESPAAPPVVAAGPDDAGTPWRSVAIVAGVAVAALAAAAVSLASAGRGRRRR